MGLFKRLRAASGARKPPESASQPTASADGSVASTRIPKRSASTDFLSVPANGHTPPPRASTSSTVASAASSPSSARSSILPWKKDKRRNTDELQSIPYESTSASPLRASGAQRPPSPTRTASVPLISTRPPSSPTRPPRSSFNGYSHPSESPSPSASRAQHTRNPSHESQRTVISLSSTFTGRSRRSTSSTEWKQDGGVLGKFAFEAGDWGAIGAATPFQSPPPSAGPSKHTTPGTSPTKLTSQSAALAMSPTPKAKSREPPKDNSRPSIRKLGASHTSPSLPSVSTFSNNPWGAHAPEYPSSARDWPQSKQLQNEKADVSMVKGNGRREGQLPVNHKIDVTAEAKAQSPSKGLVKTGSPKEEVEEIFSSTSEPDLDEKRRFWKPGMRTRRTSRTRLPEERPVSMSHVEQRPPLRRPQSSLFHNPFGRTQSRVSLAFELDQPSPVDDGSFQLKSFRHISGASDAEGGFGQYLGLSKTEDRRGSSQERSAASTIVPKRPSSAANSGVNSGAASPIPPPSPTAPPRPRPPSAAGSDSSHRVSVAAFRKNIRRPSSSVLIDDDDDVPLSLSRAQLFEGGGLRRDSDSAVSLSDASPPPRPKRALPPTPTDERRGPSPSPIGLGAPPPLRHSTSPSLGFVVKGARRNLDAKDAKNPDQVGERLPSPAPAPAPAVTGSPKVVRPPRASSRSATDEAKGASMPPIVTTPPDEPSSPMDRRSASLSPPPPPPAPLNVPEPQASADDLLIKLPPRPDELPDGPTNRETPSRGATLSPTFAMSFDEPLRRISGLWSGGTPEPSNGDKEEAFDPSLVESTLRDPQRGSGGLEVAANQENRQSLYDRLAAATSSAITTASNALPTSTSSDDRLYIPPVRTPSPPPIQAQSPGSERTASPVPAPPVLAEPPAEVPAIPHSSFGRVPRHPAEKPRGARANKQGWASSSDDDDDDKMRPRPATSASTVTTRTMAAPKPQPAAPRPHSSATMLRDVELLSGSSDEDEPLQTLKTTRSRSDLRELRPVVSRSSNSGSSVPRTKTTPEPLRPPSILKTSTGNGFANGHATVPVPRPRTGSMPNGQKAAVTPSASKWSLSSAQDSDEEELSPPVRPGSRPASRSSAHSARPASRTTGRPASRVSIARDSSADGRRPLPRIASSDHMPKLPRNKSSDMLPRNKSSDLLPRPPSTDRLRAMPQNGPNMLQPAPRHPMSMVAAADGRPTASPASSQSGLTGDSSGQGPMTPRSVAEPPRRSWADGRPRPEAESSAAARTRPASQFDWAAGAGAAGGQMPPMGYPPAMDPYGTANKQQMYAHFKAMADRHFEDMWERASSVGTANTAPQSNMFQQTYGYSYNQPPMPMMPPMPYGAYGQYPYGAFGAPQVAFPGGMPMGGMMPPMGGMPMQGMPMGGGGYGYGPGAQSVYGGEFGPPVAPGMRENAPGSPGGSPVRRARRTSGVTDVPSGRPTSMAQSSAASVTGIPTNHYVQQRATPPRRQGRRTSGLALSEAGPPSSWRASMGDELETPRPKRITNAS